MQEPRVETPSPGGPSLAAADAVSKAASADPPRLLLIDPRPLTRGCLVGSIRDAVIGPLTDVSGIDEALALAEAGAVFDAVILSLGTEEFGAASLARMITPLRTSFPNCVVLLLTSRSSPQNIHAALQHGVRAYLMTDRSLSMTLEAIRFGCTGWAMYPADEFAQLASVLPATVQTDLSVLDRRGLTPRQQEVLHCLASGMSNARIAKHLDISQSTVKAHVRGLMLRLGAVNRTQAVALLQRHVENESIPAFGSAAFDDLKVETR